MSANDAGAGFDTFSGEDFVKQKTAEAGESKPNGWTFYEAGEPEPTEWSIRDIIPKTGTGLASGQWGTFKTLTALYIALSVMTGRPFAGRFPVRRKGAVLYFALEGKSGIISRLRAIAKHDGIEERLPFACRGDCPKLKSPQAAVILAEWIREAQDYLKKEFDAEVCLVVIDTMILAAGYIKAGEDNDAAAIAAINTTLINLSTLTGAFVVGIDHFGKTLESGTRGTSAKEGNADTILALLGDRDVSGKITGTMLSVRKQRDGESGLVVPFTPKKIEVGTDRWGDPITRMVIDWPNVDEVAAATTERYKKWPKSARLLKRILETCLTAHGKFIRPFNDNLVVCAVPLDTVKLEFYRQYAPNSDDARTTGRAKRVAFSRALDTAQADGFIASREVNDIQYIWLAAEAAREPRQQPGPDTPEEAEGQSGATPPDDDAAASAQPQPNAAQQARSATTNETSQDRSTIEPEPPAAPAAAAPATDTAAQNTDDADQVASNTVPESPPAAPDIDAPDIDAPDEDTNGASTAASVEQPAPPVNTDGDLNKNVPKQDKNSVGQAASSTAAAVPETSAPGENVSSPANADKAPGGNTNKGTNGAGAGLVGSGEVFVPTPEHIKKLHQSYGLDEPTIAGMPSARIWQLLKVRRLL